MKGGGGRLRVRRRRGRGGGGAGQQRGGVGAAGGRGTGVRSARAGGGGGAGHEKGGVGAGGAAVGLAIGWGRGTGGGWLGVARRRGLLGRPLPPYLCVGAYPTDFVVLSSALWGGVALFWSCFRAPLGTIATLWAHFPPFWHVATGFMPEGEHIAWNEQCSFTPYNRLTDTHLRPRATSEPSKAVTDSRSELVHSPTLRVERHHRQDRTRAHTGDSHMNHAIVNCLAKI